MKYQNKNSLARKWHKEKSKLRKLALGVFRSGLRDMAKRFAREFSDLGLNSDRLAVEMKSLADEIFKASASDVDNKESE